jgi:hypothetical protein
VDGAPKTAATAPYLTRMGKRTTPDPRRCVCGRPIRRTDDRWCTQCLLVAERDDLPAWMRRADPTPPAPHSPGR